MSIPLRDPWALDVRDGVWTELDAPMGSPVLGALTDIPSDLRETMPYLSRRLLPHDRPVGRRRRRDRVAGHRRTLGGSELGREPLISAVKGSGSRRRVGPSTQLP